MQYKIFEIAAVLKSSPDSVSKFVKRALVSLGSGRFMCRYGDIRAASHGPHKTPFKLKVYLYRQQLSIELKTLKSL